MSSHLQEPEHPFIIYCKVNRLKPNARNAKLWDAAVDRGIKHGAKTTKEKVLTLVGGYTAVINNGVDGADLAEEIYEVLVDLLT